MSDFLLLPDAFVKYVATAKRIPITPDTDLETLRAMLETVCLEACLDGAAGSAHPRRDSAPG